MKARSHTCLFFAAVMALCSMPSLAAAEGWPSTTTRIVVPYPTGSSPDMQARLLAEKLAKRTGQPFVVENKPGANSTVGTNAVAKGPTDGSMLLLVDRLALAVNPLLYKSLPYDTHRDLVSVANIGDSNMYLVVRGDFPANTFREFVAYAKANPGQIAFGSGGKGHISHLNLEAIQAGTGIELLHVPYKGIAEVIPAMLGGQVQVTVSGVGNVQQLVKDKRVKLLAVGSPTRSALAPDVPTIREAGGSDDMLLSTGFSLHAPGGTPDAIVHAINREVDAVLTDPQVIEFTRMKGVEINAMTPEDLDLLRKQEDEAVAKLVRERNIQIN